MFCSNTSLRIYEWQQKLDKWQLPKHGQLAIFLVCGFFCVMPVMGHLTVFLPTGRYENCNPDKYDPNDKGD